MSEEQIPQEIQDVLAEADAFAPAELPTVSTVMDGLCVRCSSPLNGANYDMCFAVASGPSKPVCLRCYEGLTNFNPDPLHAQPIGPGGSLPVADLAQRLKLLSDAWVEIYEDGPLRIRFDIEGRRAHTQQTEGPPNGNGPVW
jgi:hypothetical protein